MEGLWDKVRGVSVQCPSPLCVHAGIEKLRFKPAYNPYTEPSMEVFSYHEGEDEAGVRGLV